MRRLFKWVCWLIFLGVLGIAFSNFLIISTSKSQVKERIEDINKAKVALVLGTSKSTLFFKDRVRAAADLYKAGKVRHILVSGDNRSEFYNEPKDMLEALQELGIPSSAVTLDYAGLRTLDSIVRCKEVFGQENIIIVTQRFHSYRAQFIAEFYLIESQVYVADYESTPYRSLLIREILARTKAIADLYFLKKKPKFLGDKEELTIQ